MANLGVSANPSASRAAAAHAPARAAQPSMFHQFLSELNPLQYLPVVGTLYRAITGDTIPETARIAGSLVVSGLTGGPVGIAMNVGATALEHLLGIDPEKIGNRLLADIGIGGRSASTPAAHTQASALPATSTPAQPKAWSSAQLLAYGVTCGPGGTIACGALRGADVLNSLELARLGHPIAVTMA